MHQIHLWFALAICIILYGNTLCVGELSPITLGGVVTVMLQSTEKMLGIRLGKPLECRLDTQIGTASINTYPDLELLIPSNH